MSFIMRLLRLMLGGVFGKRIADLEKLIGDGDVDGLLGLLERAKDAGLKVNVINALGDLGDVKAKALVQQLLEDDDNAVRHAAQAALGKLIK